ARCAAGHPLHPLTRELRSHLERLAPARVDSLLAGLSGLTDTATWDLASATFERRAELTAYCRRWAAAMMAPLWATEADWRALGAGRRGPGLLGRRALDAAAGRIRLPLDELARAAVAPQAVATPPWSQDLAGLLRARHRWLRQRLAAAVGALAP